MFINLSYINQSIYFVETGQVRGSENEAKGKNILIASCDNDTEMNKGHNELLFDYKETRDSIIIKFISDKGESYKKPCSIVWLIKWY